MFRKDEKHEKQENIEGFERLHTQEIPANRNSVKHFRNTSSLLFLNVIITHCTLINSSD